MWMPARVASEGGDDSDAEPLDRLKVMNAASTYVLSVWLSAPWP